MSLQVNGPAWTPVDKLVLSEGLLVRVQPGEPNPRSDGLGRCSAVGEIARVYCFLQLTHPAFLIGLIDSRAPAAFLLCERRLI